MKAFENGKKIKWILTLLEQFDYENGNYPGKALSQGLRGDRSGWSVSMEGLHPRWQLVSKWGRVRGPGIERWGAPRLSRLRPAEDWGGAMRERRRIQREKALTSLSWGARPCLWLLSSLPSAWFMSFPSPCPAQPLGRGRPPAAAGTCQSPRVSSGNRLGPPRRASCPRNAL